MVNKFLHPAGGAETYTFKVGEYLKRQGCQVEYFGMDHKENVVGNRWGLYGDPVDFHKKGILANLLHKVLEKRNRKTDPHTLNEKVA